MNKAVDAFRTISEVATDLDIPQHVLRFWETRFPTIRPLKRGGGRRYYRPDDVELLRGIRHLLYGQGYTIRGVQRIIKESGPRFVQAVGRGEQVATPGQDGYDDGPEESFEAEEEPAERPAPARRSVAQPPPEGGLALTPADLDEIRGALTELMDCAKALAALRSQ